MISASRRSHLQSLGLPPDAEMIRRSRAFAMGAGLTIADLADMAGLNPNSLRVYLAGCYDQHCRAESSTLPVRAALKQVIDRYEIAHPVDLKAAHYSTMEYEAIRKSMLSALRKGTAVLVDGPPGTQKTYTFRRVAEEINRSGEGRAVYVYARIDVSPQNFLIEACTEAGIPNRGKIDQLIRKLRFFLGGKRTLLIVDEVQHLGIEGMEILRQLLDTPPYFGVALGGSHDISVRLKDWRMQQWHSRLRRTHILNSLSEAEAKHILTAELGPLHPSDLASIIQGAMAPSRRFNKDFTYISARKLFFAIEDARQMIAEARQETAAADACTLKEAIA